MYLNKHSSSPHICFIKNEEGQREVKQISEEDNTTNESTRKIQCIVVGHIGHTQMHILELLNKNTHHISAEVVMMHHEIPPGIWLWSAIEPPQNTERGTIIHLIHSKENTPNQPLSWLPTTLLQNIEKELTISLTNSREDIPEMFFSEKKQANIGNIYYTPKTQKAKLHHRKYIPRKT